MNSRKLTMLPPPSGKCPDCAVAHEPEMPHDANSFYYKTTFALRHGRSPTWADAIEHCPPAIKAQWVEQLRKIGIDIASPNVRGDIKNEEDLKQRLNLEDELQSHKELLLGLRLAAEQAIARWADPDKPTLPGKPSFQIFSKKLFRPEAFPFKCEVLSGKCGTYQYLVDAEQVIELCNRLQDEA
jgi:hypothetical protein